MILPTLGAAVLLAAVGREPVATKAAVDPALAVEASNGFGIELYKSLAAEGRSVPVVVFRLRLSIQD